MFPVDTLAAYLVAVLVIVMAPGPTTFWQWAAA
jgi:hypothetical protein